MNLTEEYGESSSSMPPSISKVYCSSSKKDLLRSEDKQLVSFLNTELKSVPRFSSPHKCARVISFASSEYEATSCLKQALEEGSSNLSPQRKSIFGRIIGGDMSKLSTGWTSEKKNRTIGSPSSKLFKQKKNSRSRSKGRIIG